MSRVKHSRPPKPGITLGLQHPAMIRAGLRSRPLLGSAALAPGVPLTTWEPEQASPSVQENPGITSSTPGHLRNSSCSVIVSAKQKYISVGKQRNAETD